MAARDGLPCKKCGASDWYDNKRCKRCNRNRVSKWAKDNPERHREQGRRWNESNPGKRQEIHRRWKKNNPDKVKEEAERYRKNNHDKVRAAARNWRKNYPERNNAKKHRYLTQKTKAGGSYTDAEFKALCKQYDNRCLCCGKKKKLTFDHVIPVSKGGSSDISNGQPLCGKCNSSKGNKTTDYRTKPGIKRWIQPRLID